MLRQVVAARFVKTCLFHVVGIGEIVFAHEALLDNPQHARAALPGNTIGGEAVGQLDRVGLVRRGDFGVWRKKRDDRFVRSSRLGGRLAHQQVNVVAEHVAAGRGGGLRFLGSVRIGRGDVELRYARRQLTSPGLDARLRLQAGRQFREGVWCVIGDERGDFVVSRRNAEDIERHAANELLAVGAGLRHRRFALDALRDPFLPQFRRILRIIGLRPLTRSCVDCVRKTNVVPFLRFDNGADVSGAEFLFVLSRADRDAVRP